jgi:peroxiredoxin
MRKAILTMLAFLGLSVAILAGCESKEPAEKPETVRKATAFTLKSFDDKEVSLSDYKGKIVVLEWFNDECPYAKYHYEKANTMVELANKYNDKNVVWLAVNSTNHTTVKQNKDFAATYNLPYPILDDRPGKVGRAYGATNTPHMYIIDTDGNIAYEGAIDNSPSGRTPDGEKMINYVDKALVELTGGKAVSTPKTKPYGCTVKYPK